MFVGNKISAVPKCDMFELVMHVPNSTYYTFYFLKMSRWHIFLGHIYVDDDDCMIMMTVTDDEKQKLHEI